MLLGQDIQQFYQLQAHGFHFPGRLIHGHLVQWLDRHAWILATVLHQHHQARIATPRLLFKSEALVHPDEVVKYSSEVECQISYNPTLMALLWESLATRKTELLEQSLSHRHTLPPQTTWVNYLRCHDDIGWTFDDEDAAQLGINAFDHRQFLNAFYTGRFPGSFARGIPFQENEETGDVRIAGTLASLAGLELAVDHNDTIHQKLALRRIELLQAVMFSAGGIPLLYGNGHIQSTSPKRQHCDS